MYNIQILKIVYKASYPKSQQWLAACEHVGASDGGAATLSILENKGEGSHFLEWVGAQHCRSSRRSVLLVEKREMKTITTSSDNDANPMM